MIRLAAYGDAPGLVSADGWVCPHAVAGPCGGHPSTKHFSTQLDTLTAGQPPTLRLHPGRLLSVAQRAATTPIG